MNLVITIKSYGMPYFERMADALIVQPLGYNEYKNYIVPEERVDEFSNECEKNNCKIIAVYNESDIYPERFN